MIRKLKSGKFRIYSHEKDADTGKRRNLGTFDSREEAKHHEREIQFFKSKDAAGSAAPGAKAYAPQTHT